MNKERRKQIAGLIASLTEAIAAADLGELTSQAEEIREDEQEYFDNMPESLQGGERGEIATAAIEALEAAAEALGEAQEKMDEALASLEEASG